MSIAACGNCSFSNLSSSNQNRKATHCLPYLLNLSFIKPSYETLKVRQNIPLSPDI
jgi:hypothetical protein